MGLFGKKKISEEELAFKEENRKLLEAFNVTKAWGVKKYQVADQFIYDGDGKCFVVCHGPETDFREKDPWVVRFDQVEDVILEVDEYWTETKDEYAAGRGYGILTQDRYDEVYWRYDFYITIKTTHPYAKDIRFKTNFKTTIMKIPNKKMIFVRRGFEIGGTYRGKEITELVKKMEDMLPLEAKQQNADLVLDIVTRNRPESFIDGIIDLEKREWYIKKIENMTSHIKRAERIGKLLVPGEWK